MQTDRINMLLKLSEIYLLCNRLRIKLICFYSNNKSLKLLDVSLNVCDEKMGLTQNIY